MKSMLPIAMSDIHVHLEAWHVDALFGKSHSLTKWRDLTIPGQYACYEAVEVVGSKERIAGAVVVGPPRPRAQAEAAPPSEQGPSGLGAQGRSGSFARAVRHCRAARSCSLP